MNPYYEKIYALVEQIPEGKVLSYGQIARALGKPRGAREVGRAMRCGKADLPYHRVVMADGTVAGGLFADIRKAFLKNEGVTFLPDGRVDMAAFAWDMRELLEPDELR